MALKTYKPYTAGTRNRSVIDFSRLTKVAPCKSLLKYYHRAKGRNNQGKITTRHKGGGHKRLYRLIDFSRKIEGKAIVQSLEYDPNRTANIALVLYPEEGHRSYILAPENLRVGDLIYAGVKNIPLSIGNAMPLENIPVGTEIHNIELYPGRGGQFVRSAGASAKIVSKENDYVAVKLRSKEIRQFHKKCFATIGHLTNPDYYNLRLGKAGRKRWLGIRPTVRGSAMNPVDHPHGGGEGRCPIGKPKPLTPWGKIALGEKTRNAKKRSSKFIIKHK